MTENEDKYNKLTLKTKNKDKTKTNNKSKNREKREDEIRILTIQSIGDYSIKR
jgi:hypothetical protein